MKVLICGNSVYADYARVRRTLYMHSPKEIVHTDSPNLAKMAQLFAKEHRIHAMQFARSKRETVRQYFHSLLDQTMPDMILALPGTPYGLFQLADKQAIPVVQISE